MLEFPCPKCHKRLRVDEGLAGKQGRCPVCKQGIMIPTASQTTTRITAAPQPEEDAPLPTEALLAPETTTVEAKAAVKTESSPGARTADMVAQTGGGGATKKILLIAIPIIVVVAVVLFFLAVLKK